MGLEINENIKKMADLLRTGHTMLNIACPICNNPIFRDKDGEKYCPSCNRKVVLMSKNNAQNLEKSKVNSQSNQDNKTLLDKDILNSLRLVIIKKIQWLMGKFEVETQLELIKNYTDLLSNLCGMLNQITVNLKDDKS